MKLGQIEITEEDFKSVWNLCKHLFDNLWIPKNDPKRIGIVVAVRAQNKDELDRLSEDLVSELQLSLQQHQIAHLFKIITFPQQLCVKIQGDESARKYLFGSRSHLIIYGRMNKRNFEGKPSYVFHLEGLVKHRRVDQSLSNKLSAEFRELFPRRVAIPEEHEVFGFETTKDWMGYVIRYIIATAAVISGDVDTSLGLFKHLTVELENTNIPQNVPAINEIKSRLPGKISLSLLGQIARANFKFTRTNDKQFILDCEPQVKELLERDPDHYYGRLMSSMLLFFQQRVDDAIRVLRDLNERDVTWRYNLGFLYAYQGDIDSALEQYRRTQYKDMAPNILNDIDIFVSNVIETEPQLTQLLFFRGLLAHKQLNDYKLAKEDFERFLEITPDTKWPILTRLAQKYLSECRRYLGL